MCTRTPQPFRTTTNNTMVTITDAHDDLIHDAVLDYYGKRLATALSDKTIRIFDVDASDSYRLVETLVGHDGPVWQVAWAHPKFGSILASCSYDGKAIIWKEQPETRQWCIIAEHAVHQASVNSVLWAPHELGAVLLCTSSDGKVLVVDFQDDGTTAHVIFDAHAVGANSALWAPVAKDSPVRRFVTCGSDNLAKIWRREGTTYVVEATLAGHTDWVRDVCWLPSVVARLLIATASQDRTVLIWSHEGGEWKSTPLTLEKFADVCWRASWLMSGNILAVSGGDNKVTLWRESLLGGWELAGEVDQ